ncbi:MAG: AAA family ATPase [Bacillota bacterium]
MRKYQIEPHRLREMQDPDGGTVPRSDGGNAASVLREIEKDEEELRRLEEILAFIVPNTYQARQKKYGNKLVLRFTQKWGERGKERTLNFDGYVMSNGTLRILGILLAVFQRPRPSLIVLEEPERTIHPGALGAVLDLIRHASRFMQVLVTTHSPEVLDAGWITDEHLRIAVWQNGATYIRPLADDSRQALKEHLMRPGELLRTNALH